MKPTTFSPCSATMPMQLRWRRQRRKSSSVQENSKLSCSVCRTSGMSRRIIQRMWTRTCSFSVRLVLIPLFSSPHRPARSVSADDGRPSRSDRNVTEYVLLEVCLPASSAPDITHAPLLAQEQAAARPFVSFGVRVVVMGFRQKDRGILSPQDAFLAFPHWLRYGGGVEE